MTAPRPTRPLPQRPSGYLELGRYSSLKRFWNYLSAAEQAGSRLELLRGDLPETCRRRIAGRTLAGAGFLADHARLSSQLEEGGFAAHPALLALLGGDAQPLTAYLNGHYTLRLHFVLAFTQGRDLIVKPELDFVPLPTGEPLPDQPRLSARRLARDEIGVLLEKACGLRE